MNYHGEGLIKDARINGTAVIMGVPEKGIVAVKRQLRVTYAVWPAGKHNPNTGYKYLWDFTTSYDALCIAYDGRPTGLTGPRIGS